MMAATRSLGRNVLRTNPSAPPSSVVCSSVSDQLMARMRTPGATARSRRDERESGIDLGQPGVDDDDVRRGGPDEIEGHAGLAGTPDDEHAVADLEQTGQALPDPVVGIDDQHAERLVGP